MEAQVEHTAGNKGVLEADVEGGVSSRRESLASLANNILWPSVVIAH